MTVSRLLILPESGWNRVGDAADAVADPRFLRLENLDTDRAWSLPTNPPNGSPTCAPASTPRWADPRHDPGTPGQPGRCHVRLQRRCPWHAKNRCNRH